MSKVSGSLPPDHLLYAPGINRRERQNREARYFLIPPKDAKAGYPGSNRTIPKHASEFEAAEMCRQWWRDLLAWREGKPKTVNYTFTWLADRFRYDPLSPFHKNDPATQKNYVYELNAIKQSIGHIRFDPLVAGAHESRVAGADVREWHFGWGCPVEKQDPVTDKTVTVASAPSRQRHLIMMLRNIVRYGVEIKAPGAADLRTMLSAMKFSSPKPRDKTPSLGQVDALVTKAMKMGWRSIVVTTLAQFELIERRVNIIGKWQDQVWRDGWVWEGITPDWTISYYQTKRGKNLRVFDLRVTQRLLGLLQETPTERRYGPVIVCEATDRPWTKRYYCEVFREVARAAGWPDDLWSMDMRSGGATEADTIPEITDRMFDDAGGWSDPDMKNRYRRDKQRNAQTVVQLRQRARKNDA